MANSLVCRYNRLTSPDGLPGDEGTVNICTFWLVEALTRAGRTDRSRLDHARLVFERMLGYANHVGLYAEGTSMSGEALGNFPQALTHLASSVPCSTSTVPSTVCDERAEPVDSSAAPTLPAGATRRSVLMATRPTDSTPSATR
jgi:hypothetical protein